MEGRLLSTLSACPPSPSHGRPILLILPTLPPAHHLPTMEGLYSLLLRLPTISQPRKATISMADTLHSSACPPSPSHGRPPSPSHERPILSTLRLATLSQPWKTDTLRSSSVCPPSLQVRLPYSFFIFCVNVIMIYRILGISNALEFFPLSNPPAAHRAQCSRRDC